MKSLALSLFLILGCAVEAKLPSSSKLAESSDLSLAPRPIERMGKKLVPADILKSRVVWNFTEKTNSVVAEAKIQFQTSEAGFPFLLLNPNSKVMSLDGSPVRIEKVPELRGNYYFLNHRFEAQKIQELVVSYSFDYDPATNKNFLPLDYGGHSYIEMGFPGNAIFDRFPVDLTIAIQSQRAFKVIANASSQTRVGNRVHLQFPEYFHSMSFFIDLVPKEDLVSKASSVTSIDGRQISIFGYSTKEDTASHLVATFVGNVEQTLRDLEKRFGKYPYESVIVNVSNKMKGTGSYAGALSLSSFYIEHIAHELGHHWMLQGVSPLNGADTWLYEGFGYWVPYLDILGGFEYVGKLEKAIQLDKGEYSLWSDKSIFPIDEVQSPHQSGAMVLAAINQRIKKRGKRPEASKGLGPVLKKIIAEKMFQTMSTAEFKRLLEKHSGVAFDDLFAYYFVE